MRLMILLRGTVGALAVLTAGCGLLDVSDPVTVQESDIANTEGAELLRRKALGEFYKAVGGAAVYGGLLADEFLAETRFPTANFDELVDRRQSIELEMHFMKLNLPYVGWQQTRFTAADALRQLRAYAPEPPQRAYLGQMFTVRGFATVGLAEDVCPGLALNETVDGRIRYGPALTTPQLFEAALAEFDSALSYAADSTRILRLAWVGRARTLVGLGRFAEAVAAAAEVPTDYVARAEFHAASSFTDASQPNVLSFGSLGTGFFEARSVADEEGGNGMDFVSAGDPRVETTVWSMAIDGVTPLYRATKYPTADAPIVVASGLEARLIEAEAALNGGGDWLGILNALRTDGTYTTQPNPDDPAQTDTLWNAGSGGVAGLAPLTDPGTLEARVNLLFRERAFWLFGTGHRLGDLRRLIAQYGRSAENGFPTGPYRLGGVYAQATSLPFPSAAESLNPSVTACTTR